MQNMYTIYTILMEIQRWIFYETDVKSQCWKQTFDLLFALMVLQTNYLKRLQKTRMLMMIEISINICFGTYKLKLL